MRRRLMLPAMVAILVAYAAAHSPVLRLLARLAGAGSGTCYFLCSGWAAYGHPMDAAAAIACVLLAVFAAWAVGRRWTGLASERAVGFGLVAMTLAAVPAAWIGLLGWAVEHPFLRPPAGPLLAAIPAVAVLVFALRGSPSERGAGKRVARPRGLIVPLAVTAVALLAISAIVAVAHPPAGYDALSYHAPLAVYYWRDGDIASFLEREPWAWALAHPGAAELWFGLLRVAGGERVANLGQLPFAAIGAVAVHLLGRRTGLSAGGAALGGLAFLLAPLVVVQSGMQLNDLAAGALLLAAMALAAAPPARWSRERLAGLGLALGLAVTTKLAVVPAAAGVVLFAAIRLRSLPARNALAGWSALGFLLVVAPWWIRNAALYGNPIFPAALPIIGRGYVVGDFVRKDSWFVPSELAWPLYPLIESHGEMSGFGALFAVAALPGLLVAYWRGRRGPLALVALVGLLSLVAWWRLTQHEPRLILGVVGAAFVGVGWALTAVPRRQRALGAVVLAAAGGYSAAVTLDQGLRPLASFDGSRAAYYEAEWGIDSVAAGLPPGDGLLYHTGYAHRSYAGDYPLLGPSQGRSLTVIDGVLPADSIASLMRGLRLRYAYVPVREADDAIVRGMYPADRFDLVHSSSFDRGHWATTRRYLFRLRAGSAR